MKKILLLTVTILLFAMLLVACTEPAETTLGCTSDTTPAETPTVTTPSDDPNEDLFINEDYTAVLNDFEWVKDDVDYSEYDKFGSGAAVINEINRDYNGYKKTLYVIGEDGAKTEATAIQIRKLGTVGAMIAEEDETARTCVIEFREMSVRVATEWSAVRARAGTYLMFDFTTNCPVGFCTTVTATEGGSADSAAYLQEDIPVTGASGKYTGVAKCTVPYAAGKTFYINICVDNENAGYPVIASIPVEITTAKYDSPYSLIFQGDWEEIRHDDYLDNLVELFYNVYPRLYARFADGSEPKTITFMADKDYEGIAYCAGTVVCVSTDYANSNPSDIGFFAHEITHSVQQYGGKMYYGDGAWWTEFMADLGRFRYFHWGYSTEYVKFYSMDDPAIRDFGWEPYGQHNIFAAYLDSRYPTTIDENGNITYGLVDSINRMIKATTVELSDNPKTPGTPFNNMVKEITGYETMEALRLAFVKELDEGTWKFTGYRDYLDNFQTEGIDGVPDPTYPMDEPITPGDKTNPKLDTVVTEGTNLALNATVAGASTEGTSRYNIANAFDGDLTTKWQGAETNDKKYELGGYQHEFIIDLGEVKSFDTYTLVNAGSKENARFNTKEWELLVSTDGVNFTSVDYQNEQNEGSISINVGEQSARYVMLRIYEATNANVATVRLYEFMLFDL